ncbi:MAG: Ig-like domain-containing protein [Candidatus Thermoplasmatota archaeon]
MRYKWLVALTVVVVFLLLIGYYAGFFGTTFHLTNGKPTIAITYPFDKTTVSKLVMISGTAGNSKGEENISKVQIKIGENTWVTATGTTLWSYDWTTYSVPNGQYTIHARSFDGEDYSDIVSVNVTVNNPTAVDSGAHKWALFIIAANFPKNNETKLGNGGLYLAEAMAAYFIEHNQYPTSQIMILFDDGWIRSDNGYGAKLKTLQERAHKYDISYGGATEANVLASLDYLINESNKYSDSEVFLWIFNHGVGNSNKTFTGGKLLQNSEIFLWDDTVTDKELGVLLAPLTSKKVAILIDACYAGGFADRTILDFRTSLFFRSGIPQNGRVVISATSKFRPGYASTIQGPLFSLLWFEGLVTGEADGYRPGLFDRGVFRKLKVFHDGEVSVEEAFYYARAMLRTDEKFQDFKTMQPQINDAYPHRGLLRNQGGLILSEH